MSEQPFTNDIQIPVLNNNTQQNDSTPVNPSDRSTFEDAQRMLAMHQGLSRMMDRHNTEGNSGNLFINTLASPNASSISQSPAFATPATQNEIVSVINICNDIDKEEHCVATDTLVKRCIKTSIWTNNKFITDHTIKNMAISDRQNRNSILNMMLSYTRKENLSDAHRFRFWKKYAPIVQKELNIMKSVCTRQIKNRIMAGKSTKSVFNILKQKTH